ncbi:MAG: creatininase family protein [Rhodobacteraceae bacterium]|nr:creatininase family protein [Paracoccaceae bacterium]
MATGVWLEDLTWPEAAERFARGAVVVVPIGAASKEHGHHLPLCTDYLLARGIMERVLAELPVVAAPVISLGYYPAFRHYPGSQHLSPATFGAVVREVLGGFVAQGVTRLAVLNTGVSTEPVVNIELREMLEATGVRIPCAHIRALGRAAEALFAQDLGGHGDEHETALIEVIAPERIRRGLARPDYGNAREMPRTAFYVPTLFAGEGAEARDFSATGVRGDPTLATPEKGEAAMAATVGDVVSGLRALFPGAFDG